MRSVGLEEYGFTLFMVTSDGSAGEVFEDPADAIALAEENCACEGGNPWYVIALQATDDPPVHTAQRRKKPKKGARTT